MWLTGDGHVVRGVVRGACVAYFVSSSFNPVDKVSVIE